MRPERPKKRLAKDTPRGKVMMVLEANLDSIVSRGEMPKKGATSTNLMWEKWTPEDIEGKPVHSSIGLNNENDLKERVTMLRELLGKEALHIAEEAGKHTTNHDYVWHVPHKHGWEIPGEKGKFIPVNVRLQVSKGVGRKDAWQGRNEFLAAGTPEKVIKRLLAHMPEHIDIRPIGGLAEIEHGVRGPKTADVDLVARLRDEREEATLIHNIKKILDELSDTGEAELSRGGLGLRGELMVSGEPVQVHIKLEDAKDNAIRRRSGRAISPVENAYNAMEALARRPQKEGKRMETLRRYFHSTRGDHPQWEELASRIRGGLDKDDKMTVLAELGRTYTGKIRIPPAVRKALEED